MTNRDSNNTNGVIRIDRKGIKKFAFGEGDVFEVDVVTAWQKWLTIDEKFRPSEIDDNGNTREDRSIPNQDAPDYYRAAQVFVKELGGGDITVAEALEFLARLREQWSDLVSFFRPRSKEERELPGTSEAPSVELHFSEEPQTNQSS